MTAHRARKRFGQHFLRDPGVIAAILDAIAPAKDDIIVEIGPGEGAITGQLARRAGQLHAVELDRDLAARLRDTFAGSAAVSIHDDDALRFDFTRLGDRLRIVGNLPYNISTPLLFHLLEQRRCIRDMHFMLQKEVVDRIAARPGSKAYGRLGIMLGCRFAAEPLFDVDPTAFVPAPAVTSALVRLTPLPEDHHDIVDAALLSKLVAAAFSQRRKTVRNALRDWADTAQLEEAGIEPDLRPEAIDIEHYIALSNRLAGGQ